MDPPRSKNKNSVRTTPKKLESLGFKVKNTVRTSNHILYFCSAPFGRPALVIQDRASDEVDTTAIEGDEGIDARICLVHEGTIILTYPEADYVTYYSTDVPVKEGEYYIAQLEDILDDSASTSRLIDDYFTSESRKFYEEKIQSVKKFNEILAKLRDSQEESRRMATLLENNFKEMNALRERVNRMLENGKANDAIDISEKLEKLLSSTQSTVESYSILAEGLLNCRTDVVMQEAEYRPELETIYDSGSED